MPLKDINTKEVEALVYEPKDIDYSDQKLSKRIESVSTLLGYKGLTKDKYSFIVTKGRGKYKGGYAEMVVTSGQNVRNLTNAISNQVVSDAGKLFKALEVGTDITFLAYSFRENTQQQQAAWSHKLSSTEQQLQKATTAQQKSRLKRRIHMIQDEINIQKRVEQNLWSREYLMIVFGDTKEDLITKMRTLKNLSLEGTAPFSYHTLTTREKEERLYTLNNPADYMAQK
jgi:hypothetical protein